MNPLLAQQTTPLGFEGPRVTEMVSMSAVALALLLLLLVGGGFLLLLVRNAQRRREWAHVERMRALEMGLPVPPHDASRVKAAVCIAIGAGVPLMTFGIALAAYQEGPVRYVELWIAPGIVSGLGVVGACILTGILFGGKSSPEDPTGAGGATAHRNGVKPAYDPDALDVVGRRG